MYVRYMCRGNVYVKLGWRLEDVGYKTKNCGAVGWCVEKGYKAYVFCWQSVLCARGLRIDVVFIIRLVTCRVVVHVSACMVRDEVPMSVYQCRINKIHVLVLVNA